MLSIYYYCSGFKCLKFTLLSVTVSENSVDKTAENAQPQENIETPVNAAPGRPPKTPFHQVALTPFNPSKCDF